jgi:hypothetical protein
LLTDSEITDLDLTFTIEKNVVELNVSVPDVLRMNVLKTLNNLLEDLLRKRLLQSSPLPNIVEEVTSCTKLHDNYNVFVSLNCLVDLYNVVVSEFQEQVDFLHQLLLLNLICQTFFVQ